MGFLKKALVIGGLTTTLFAVNSISIFASTPYPHAGPDRPANTSGITTPYTSIIVPHVSESANEINTPSAVTSVTIFPEPSTIRVSIWDRDSTGREIAGTYDSTVTVNFETYVKDVLPNEWIEDWHTDGMESLKAGALAVKTYGWYHTKFPKDSEHSADVNNGTSSQMYTAGSNQPYCNQAVAAVDKLVIGSYTINSNSTVTTKLVETGYLANQTTPGTIMGQNASYKDAKAGMSYTEIIAKWYANLGVKVCPQTIQIPVADRVNT